METSRHTLMDNSVQLFRRPRSPYWQCSCTVAGRQRKHSTNEESLARAKDVARDWYLGLLGKYREGELKEGKTFREAANRFMNEFEVITQGERSPIYVEGHRSRITSHLIPFFGRMVLSEITAGTIQDYRIHRMKTGMSRADQLRKETTDENGKPIKVKPPAFSTLHQEIVCLRQILKTANRHGWLEHIPIMSAPFRQSNKISHRAWFSPEEYNALVDATRARAKKPLNPRWQWANEQLHDFVLFMANTGLRPDEVYKLEFRDVDKEYDPGNRKDILVISVRGKRGVGYCKSMPMAVHPFERLKKRKRPARLSRGAKAAEAIPEAKAKGDNAKASNKEYVLPQDNDLLFPEFHTDQLKQILNELGLKKDREGNDRTAYSLRHTYISMRLMEGADIYQIAKNCRTSVEMIEKYYASHIKDRLDTAAINVRKRQTATQRKTPKKRA